MMEKVDFALREKGIPPYARPIQGWLCISASLSLGLSMFPKEQRNPREGCYTGDDLTIRIFRWFDERYGEKLNMPFGPGRVFMVIRHDPWIITFPQVYGKIKFFISPTEESSRPEVYLKTKQIPRYNVLEAIDGLPDGLKKTLTNAELKEIFHRFDVAYQSMLAVSQVEETPMVKEAKSDIEAAIEHATHRPPHYGQSKWCSLQAAEKLLKAYLVTRDKQFPTHHKLAELTDLAESAGLSPIDRNLLELIQCSASIRYGEVPTSLGDAFQAHWAAVIVCGHVARNISRAA